MSHETPIVDTDACAAIGIDPVLRSEAVTDVTGLARPSVYRRMQEGTFPLPVRLGEKAVAWRASDIIAWLNDLPTAPIKLREGVKPWSPRKSEQTASQGAQ